MAAAAAAAAVRPHDVAQQRILGGRWGQLQQPNSVVWLWALTVLKGGTYKWRKRFIHSALQEVFLSDARTAKMGMVRVL